VAVFLTVGGDELLASYSSATAPDLHRLPYSARLLVKATWRKTA
jgi:hypothetical protein